MLSLLKAIVQLLVGELKSHKLHGIVKKKKKKAKKKKKYTATPHKKKKKKLHHIQNRKRRKHLSSLHTYCFMRILFQL